MSRFPAARAAASALLAGLCLLPLAAAQGAPLYVEPRTEEARQVQALFHLTLWLALVVFVFVEGLLLYVLWKARRTKYVPREETHRGHTKAEIVWTVIPALTLLGLGVASAGTLFHLDDVPDDADVVVNVTARQFAWTYDYSPTEGFDRAVTRSAANTLHVETGKVVRLDLRATDVIHSYFVPEFALKIDAFPDRITHQWFTAPEPGEYFMQCTEYCGVGHHIMQGKIVVFPAGTQPVPYGLYTPPEPPANATESQG